jgi:hypothetical protein
MENIVNTTLNCGSTESQYKVGAFNLPNRGTWINFHLSQIKLNKCDMVTTTIYDIIGVILDLNMLEVF